jgi:succinoglycan biosynthesis protein ExoM
VARVSRRGRFMIAGTPVTLGIPVVSVCVCTYRRPHLLATLLDDLAGQDFCGPFEVIIVDNDPAGSATEVVENARERHPTLNIRYAVEARKGISFARNRAVSLALGEFVAWIDDDESTTAKWLSLLLRAKSMYNADAVFGPVIPVFPEGSSSWPIRSRIFERPRHSSGTFIHTREARTGNALVKRDWFRSFTAPFDIKLANTGGEDFDFFARIERKGARFVWCDEAEVSEIVPLERQRLLWVLERKLRGSANYWRRESVSGFRAALRALAGAVIFIMWGVAGIIVAPLAFHYTVRLWYRAIGGLGRVIAISRLQWDGY